MNNIREERFILADGFMGFSQWSASSIVSGSVVKLNIMVVEMCKGDYSPHYSQEAGGRAGQNTVPKDVLPVTYFLQ
jgi:hypothetical protein